MKRLRLLLAIALMLANALAQGETTPSSGSSIRIKRIQPSIAQLLKPGEKVTFVVELQYTLAADSGKAELIVQRAESGYGALAHAFSKLSRGSGNITLQTEVEIPLTTTIQIFTPLYHDGGGSTSVVDSRVYEIAIP